MFLLCKVNPTFPNLQRTVYPLLYHASDSKRCCVMCNADETFWQMCITVIGLKKPPAKVCICDESVKSAVLRVYCWQVRRKCLCTAVSVFITSTDIYGHGVGSGIFSSHVEISDTWHSE